MNMDKVLGAILWIALIFMLCRAVLGMAEQSVNDSSRYAQEYQELLKQVQQEQGQYISPADQMLIEMMNYKE